ncbi:toxin C-terminal domain-containing protein [Lactococcus paracarnosus]|uniref:Novel toxin 21 domain-containing protein n=1 Tax=Pseudolactococcus paracarnosus TaxID=2749962 RepID=A0ABT0ALE1_9LACT|nr:hypothetical protein [Lactococcus paracarnosus]MCJ1983488.1 hypothetical protein [Lactococcus paracarnosus]MCJ1998158.1 hypothetical protein [Lactococcus paracarnosus]
MFSIVKKTRSGTYDKDLNRIGD